MGRIWLNIVLSCGPVLGLRVFRGLPVLFLVEACSVLPVVTIQMSTNVTECPLGGKIVPS